MWYSPLIGSCFPFSLSRLVIELSYRTMRPLLFSHETDTVIPEKLQVGEIIRLCWIYFVW